MPCLYMHFYLEHNFGHHKNVATPLDPATSKLNQTVYHFWIVSVFQQYVMHGTYNLNFYNSKNSLSFLSRTICFGIR